jgi:hypothetical protein
MNWGKLLMRIMVATMIGCLSTAGAIAATDALAAIRRPTSIPEQLLDDALQILAKERDVQMIYPYAVVAERHTGGAQGELTVGEALDQLLAGTGLQYRYLDDKTITISSARQTSNGAQPSAPSQDEKGAQKSNFWGPFRLAQVAAGQASAELVVSGSEREAGPDERYLLNANVPSYELVGRPRTIGIEAQIGF